MKREVVRERRLPAFALDVGDLELLLERLLQLFDLPADVKTDISLKFPGERLHFESMEELKNFSGLRGTATDFSVRMRQGNESVEIRLEGIMNKTPYLRAESDSDLWCASAMEAAWTVIRPNRLWYNWFIRLPLTFISLVLALGPPLIGTIFPNLPSMRPAMAIPYFAAVVAMIYLSNSKEKLLPVASIVFTKELGFIRRYGSELGLALGLISLGLALYTWLNPITP